MDMLGLHTSLHQFLFLAPPVSFFSLEHILIEFHIEVGNQFRPEFPRYSASITHSVCEENYILEKEHKTYSGRCSCSGNVY